MYKELDELIRAATAYKYTYGPPYAVASGSKMHINLNAAISNAKSALATGGWHKWPDEKPENDGEYNVIIDFDTKFVSSRDFLDGHFVEDGIFGGWEECDNDVLAWQPLPPLPKEDK